MTVLRADLQDACATARLGSGLASALEAARSDMPGPWTIFLRGPLGAGKTTFVRGVLRGLGHAGTVKSPTYTLVEPYELASLSVYHLDLYRLGDPEELELLGVRDYLRPGALCLVEWPERAGGLWSAPDLDLGLFYNACARRVEVVPHTPSGARILAAWPVGGGARAAENSLCSI